MSATVANQILLLSQEIAGAVTEIGAEYRIDFRDGTSRNATTAEILAATKAAAIAANRAECSSRIYARYPAGRQLSASFGLYDSANVATMVDWIAANVAAENTAADAIEAAATVAAVEAVTVAWPV